MKFSACGACAMFDAWFTPEAMNKARAEEQRRVDAAVGRYYKKRPNTFYRVSEMTPEQIILFHKFIRGEWKPSID